MLNVFPGYNVCLVMGVLYKVYSLHRYSLSNLKKKYGGEWRWGMKVGFKAIQVCLWMVWVFLWGDQKLSRVGSKGFSGQDDGYWIPSGEKHVWCCVKLIVGCFQAVCACQCRTMGGKRKGSRWVGKKSGGKNEEKRDIKWSGPYTYLSPSWLGICQLYHTIVFQSL